MRLQGFVVAEKGNLEVEIFTRNKLRKCSAIC